MTQVLLLSPSGPGTLRPRPNNNFQNVLFGCTTMFDDAGTHLKIAHAVLAARVRRYMIHPLAFSSRLRCHWPGSWQHPLTKRLDIRDLLRQQSMTQMSHSINRTSTTFLSEPPFSAMSNDHKTIKAPRKCQNKLTMMTPKGIRKVIAEIMSAAPKIQDIVHTAKETVS